MYRINICLSPQIERKRLLIPNKNSPQIFRLEFSADGYERRDKPSVLVTSPGSPDMHGRTGTAGGSSSGGARYASRLTPAGPVIVDPNIGGRIQIKMGFEAGTLQLIVTIVCAAGLTLRANGAARNPYVKVNYFRCTHFLLSCLCSISLTDFGYIFCFCLFADIFASRSMR